MERLEIVDIGRRRRFSREMKLQIVAESYSEPGQCATTARRHGISRSQLYEWRRLARAWQLDIAAPFSGFVPAVVAPEPGAAASSTPGAGRIEVVAANGRRLIVDGSVDVEVLVQIVRGLETLR
ncbi:transposase (plasmid) [Rhizobium sp. CB3090]|uniref:IS66-like element accessory protein TnpA n=1 Tax=Rhizobium sp. CB3090 TaxID=3039156 RepID=UPI0024B19E41|nr:transposase [Rhizobium sp. CB3090]WFU13133.1 transposase [Rhizobium sp. CB3090]